MSVETPADDNSANVPRNRHQVMTAILAGALLSGVLLVVCAAVAATAWLNQYYFLHFPLGFYLVAQGLLILIVASGFWFVRAQERLDRARRESEEMG